jgi:hypothetical protein
MRWLPKNQKILFSVRLLVSVLGLVCVTAFPCPAANEHRSRAVAREFQHQHPCPATGQTSGPCPGYWRDHIVPLACGGADAVENMQWQTIDDAKAKDAWERQVCQQ